MALCEQVYDAAIAGRLAGDENRPVETESDLLGNRRGAVVAQKPTPIRRWVVKAADGKAALEPSGPGENIPAVHPTPDESPALGMLGGTCRHRGREAVRIFSAPAESDVADISGRAGLGDQLFPLAGRETSEDNGRMTLHTRQ
jgi:hypothetical protein